MFLINSSFATYLEITISGVFDRSMLIVGSYTLIGWNRGMCIGVHVKWINIESCVLRKILSLAYRVYITHHNYKYDKYLLLWMVIVTRQVLA